MNAVPSGCRLTHWRNIEGMESETMKRQTTGPAWKIARAQAANFRLRQTAGCPCHDKPK
ncbi:acyl-CoA synthetase [Mycobacterium tuberculosis]|uniref:Acyl-CoA synthetase n=4 Tax=Mycobacterium tuberculosis complex TaxID=77643 RepID=A0A074QAL1_MYCTX|nr:acyl-CoA synthetase [Mycobacterium tuberculosis]ALE45859.1 acyl-CoA synthetase [Mycobacterium tuberculosis variant bovis]AMO12640.1 acyl-CoA synthetase [Mycobacterium tuberculosis variant bovis BCG str. Tokyo 172]AMQ40898.1 acyl-CoA synthetase [Mycobacterium tuberculosis variant africanum]APU28129.1 acyl-CoA synthetase [Mycobacterium tuberculosis variant caprae]AQN84726.1 acyl-CoA synthetase [Mycobacterium tuberculosis TRS9]AQN88625.1 acyl-CoA synthetase [Mycobacterium tuberculosis 1821ADB